MTEAIKKPSLHKYIAANSLSIGLDSTSPEDKVAFGLSVKEEITMDTIKSLVSNSMIRNIIQSSENPKFLSLVIEGMQFNMIKAEKDLSDSIKEGEYYNFSFMFYPAKEENAVESILLVYAKPFLNDEAQDIINSDRKSNPFHYLFTETSDDSISFEEMEILKPFELTIEE